MPAWLLIKAVSKTHPDSKIDLRAMYKAGDVVAVLPDGWTPGKKEGLPNFYRVYVTDRDPVFLEKYLLAEEGDVISAEDPMLVKIRRRRYGVSIDDLPNAVKSQLNRTGEISINWGDINTRILEKATNTNEGTRT